MTLALVLSSFVAASRIGGAAQQYVLAAHGIDPVLVPTVMLGRSPAKGAQGQATPPELFARMLADVEADALFGLVDLVITGHFSLAEQVEIAADALDRVIAAREVRPVVVVDPILGDTPKGLYVSAAVAEAVASQLVPLADWITPNLWELGHLAGAVIDSAPAAVAAARRLGKPALVTSVPAGAGEIGLLMASKPTTRHSSPTRVWIWSRTGQATWSRRVSAPGSRRALRPAPPPNALRGPPGKRPRPCRTGGRRSCPSWR